MDKKSKKIVALIVTCLMLVASFAEAPAVFAAGEAGGELAVESQNENGKGTVGDEAAFLDRGGEDLELQEGEQDTEPAPDDDPDPEPEADYSAVDAALAKIPEDLSIYTQDSADAVREARDAVVRDLPATEQDKVDKMAKDIEDAVAGLVKKTGGIVIWGNPLQYGDNSYFYVRLYSTRLTDYSKEWYKNYEGNVKVKLDARFVEADVSEDPETGTTYVGEKNVRAEDQYNELVKKGWTFVFAIKTTNGTLENLSDDEYVKDNLTYDQIGQKGKNKGMKFKVENGKAYYLEIRATDPADPDNTKVAMSLPRNVKYVFLDAPKDLKVDCKEGDNRATLKWKKVSGAVCYAIYAGTNGKCPAKPIAHTKQDSGDLKYTTKYLKGPKTYTFYVKAMYRNTTGGSSGSLWTISEPSNGVKLKIKDRLLDIGVRVIKWKATLNYATTVYSNSGCTSKKASLSKGAKVYCIGKYPRKIPRGGHPTKFQVQYTDKKGKTIKGWVKYGPIRHVGGEVAYKGGKDYDWSKQTKEDYVNSNKFSSKTGYLIWLSTYTQRVNIFKGSKGKWELVKSERCTTGRFYQPTGLTPNYTVHRHQSIRYRNFYRSTRQYYYKYLSYFSKGNSFHTECWAVGSNRDVNHVKGNLQPGTMGCVRMHTSPALWIYKNIPLGTKVVSH